MYHQFQPIEVRRNDRSARRIGLRGKVVMVGRDIGTVRLPEADLKIYLDASRSTCAPWTRRSSPEVEAFIRKSCGVKAADRIDSSRKYAPLKPARDAVIINSDDLTVDEVVAKILALIDP
jgi:cytidylate kinase